MWENHHGSAVAGCAEASFIKLGATENPLHRKSPVSGVEGARARLVCRRFLSTFAVADVPWCYMLAPLYRAVGPNTKICGLAFHATQN